MTASARQRNDGDGRSLDPIRHLLTQTERELGYGIDLTGIGDSVADLQSTEII